MVSSVQVACIVGIVSSVQGACILSSTQNAYNFTPMSNFLYYVEWFHVDFCVNSLWAICLR